MAATRLSSPSVWGSATTIAFSTRPRPNHARATVLQSRVFHTGRRSQASYGRGFNYQRFQTTSSLLRRWVEHPNFYYHVTGLSGTVVGIYLYNREEVPVSGRKRFNIVSEKFERESGAQLYQQTMQEFGHKILPQAHPKHQMVQRVLDRLIPHSGLPSEKNAWVVHVIDDETMNAFVIPGGKVFVFSGILDVCQGDAGLAAVLGHEIAHNLAHHAAEKMSQSSILMLVAYVASYALGIGDVGLANLLVDIGFSRPHGRKQEVCNLVVTSRAAPPVADITCTERGGLYWTEYDKTNHIILAQLS